MRLRLAAVTLAIVFTYGAPADAATIFTLGLSDGSAADPSSILSFSFQPLGAGGMLTVVKELDTLSSIVQQSVAVGTIYPEATFSAFEDLVSPGSLLFRYDMSNAFFTAYQLSGTLETITISAERIVLTRGPASVPEPAVLLLLATAAAPLLHRRTRRAHRRECVER